MTGERDAPSRQRATPPGVEALAGLYLREAPRLRSLAYLLTGSPEWAADVVQDAFAAIGPRLAGVDDPAAYLRTTVVHGARRRAARAAGERRWAPDAELSEVAAAAASLGSTVTDRVAVRRALAELTVDQREAIVLRFFADLTYEQIGDALGWPTQTAATNVRRGLRRLRSFLEER